jgi:hypothetical protein
VNESIGEDLLDSKNKCEDDDLVLLFVCTSPGRSLSLKTSLSAGAYGLNGVANVDFSSINKLELIVQFCFKACRVGRVRCGAQCQCVNKRRRR